MNLFRRPKPKGKLPEEASVLIRSVFTLDAMRQGIFAPELRKLHRELKDARFLSAEGVSWSSLRRDINELINFPEKSERIGRFVSRLPILNVLLLVSFAVIATAAVLDLYVLRRYPLTVIVLPGIAFMAGVSTLRWYYEEMVRGFFETAKPKADKIRRVNNLLIAKLVSVLREGKYPFEKCTFALYNADYQNIVIKSKPRIYRGYYEVYPKSPDK
jgi:hypothetical protein